MYCLIESSQFSWVYFSIHPFWKVIQINVGAPQKPSLTCKLSYVSLHINCIQMLISYIYYTFKPKHKIIRYPSIVWGVINSIPSFLVILPDYLFLLVTKYHTNHQFSPDYIQTAIPFNMSICSTEPSWREVSSYITPPHQLRVKMRPGKTHDDLFAKEAGYIVGKSLMFLSKFANLDFFMFVPTSVTPCEVLGTSPRVFFCFSSMAAWLDQSTHFKADRVAPAWREVRRARRGHPGFPLSRRVGIKNVCQLGNWYVRLIDSDFRHRVHGFIFILGLGVH